MKKLLILGFFYLFFPQASFSQVTGKITGVETEVFYVFNCEKYLRESAEISQADSVVTLEQDSVRVKNGSFYYQAPHLGYYVGVISKDLSEVTARKSELCAHNLENVFQPLVPFKQSYKFPLFIENVPQEISLEVYAEMQPYGEFSRVKQSASPLYDELKALIKTFAELDQNHATREEGLPLLQEALNGKSTYIKSLFDFVFINMFATPNEKVDIDSLRSILSTEIPENTSFMGYARRAEIRNRLIGQKGSSFPYPTYYDAANNPQSFPKNEWFILESPGGMGSDFYAQISEENLLKLKQTTQEIEALRRAVPHIKFIRLLDASFKTVAIPKVAAVPYKTGYSNPTNFKPLFSDLSPGASFQDLPKPLTPEEAALRRKASQDLMLEEPVYLIATLGFVHLMTQQIMQKIPSIGANVLRLNENKTLILVNPEGQVVARTEGENAVVEMREVLEKL